MDREARNEPGLRPDLAAKLASGKLTPMMRQYLTVKSEYPHALVLFRMGDFFETFYDDAEDASKLLEITLTKRSKDEDAAPMAGVPHHAVEGYIARLIDLGRTVVLVDQVEDPKKAKGLVRREVTQVISPGTYVDAKAPARLPRYLVSVAFKPTRSKKRPPRWGLAALDIGTGEFRATAGEGDDNLVDEVARLGTRELIFAASCRDLPGLRLVSEILPQVVLTELQPDLHGDLTSRMEALNSCISAKEIAALAQLLPETALEAAAGAVAYAHSTQLRSESFARKKGGTLGHIDTLRPYLPGDALILDADARRHLELFESAGQGGRKGSLIGVIDQAVTSMGARLTARWLARPLLDPDKINQRLDAVAAFVASPSTLDELRRALGDVYDLERLVGRVVMGRSNPRDLAALRISLGRMPSIFALAAEASSGEASSRLEALASVEPCGEVFEIISEALVDAPPTDFGKDRVFCEGFDKELDELFALSREGKEILANIEQRERERTKISSLKVKYNKVFGYFIEVTKANLSLVPDDYVRKQTMVNAERYYTAELKEYEDQVLTADERRTVREAQLFSELVARVASQSGLLKTVADAAAELDALSGLAHLAERGGWRRPEVDGSGALDIEDGRHPVLEALSSELGERFVPNDLAFVDERRLLIITGPNMAGKSTIMRQTALVVILAQMGSFVPARRAHVGVVDRVFTRVGASDDLSRGRSTFMVEMNETARIVRSATARSLIVLDEIGRGTSTFDGLAIAWAVAEFIHDQIGAKTLFATHYHELTEICREKEHAANLHVAVKQWNDDIVFLRKLAAGPTNRSYGVQVARLAGLPDAIIQRARKVLANLEAQELSAGDRARVAGGGGQRAQLHLFAGASVTGGPTAEEAEVLEELKATSVDDISPRQALDMIAAWQSLLDD